jgi:hypothetical protein
MTFTQTRKNPTVVPRYAPIAPILMTCRQVHQSVNSHLYHPHLFSLIRSLCLHWPRSPCSVASR